MTMTLFEKEALRIRKDYLRGIITEDEYTHMLDEIATAIIATNEVE